MENTNTEKKILDDRELDEVNGGAAANGRFKCPRCRHMTMVVKYKSFRCTNPGCGYVHKM